MLFAAGYAACLHSALRLVAGQGRLDVTGGEITASAGIGPRDNGGSGPTAGLRVSTPDLGRPAAEALAARAREVWPYSRATRDNSPVTLTTRQFPTQ
jgi:lipoyl-dependent peroxiredoxin